LELGVKVKQSKTASALGGENRNNAREKPEAKTRIGNIESKSD
jgi:hypothetical protein